MTIQLVEAVAARAGGRPEDLAVVTIGEHAVTALSWRDLWRKSERIASLLLELEVHPGEPVAYQLPNCEDFAVITLAILRAGAVCCPLMPIYRERELAWILERSRARVLFVRDAYRSRCPIDEITALLPQMTALEHLVAVGGSRPAVALPETDRLSSCWLEQRLASIRPDARALEARSLRPDAVAQLLFTSGTTGAPKGVLHRYDVLTAAARLAIGRLGLTRRDRVYIPSPLAHQTGFLYGMWLALILGATQVLQERWDPRQALSAMREHGATFVQAATPFLTDLVQAVEGGMNPPERLRIFVATGAAVPRALARRAAESLRTKVCGAFGTTEGCLATLSSPSDSTDTAWNTDGRPLASVSIRVCDDAGQALPPGREGHLQVRSLTMFDGYLDDPQATASAYTADGWYRTGDLAIIGPDGHLRLTGRVKDVINRGGEKIPVADLEQLLHLHEAVREVAIVAMPDARLGERACAFVATRAGSFFDFRAMLAFLEERKVAKPYWPERLELLDELPKTASGKIQKFILRERARALSPVERVKSA